MRNITPHCRPFQYEHKLGMATREHHRDKSILTNGRWLAIVYLGIESGEQCLCAGGCHVTVDPAQWRLLKRTSGYHPFRRQTGEILAVAVHLQIDEPQILIEEDILIRNAPKSCAYTHLLWALLSYLHDFYDHLVRPSPRIPHQNRHM